MRLSPTPTTGTTTYTYDATNRLTQIELPDSSIQAYTWDARGNLLRTGAFTYSYDAAGRMVRAASVDLTSVYTYTADGLRVVQAVDGAVTAFAWDWATGVPELLTDGDKLYLVGHDTLGWADAAGWTYAVPDALGSVRQVVDASGAVVDAREWTPYGVEVGDAQAGLGYTGEWWDAAVGLQYLRARWYDARTGAFLTRDAVEANHPYLYANGNPVRYTDPSGHDVGCPGRDALACAGFPYRRQDAVSYAAHHNCDWTLSKLQLQNAWDYVRGRNPYSPFHRANCTHFVSQALHAGGMPMTTDWYYEHGKSRAPITTGCGDKLWNAPCTSSWGAAPDLKDYLTNILGLASDYLQPVKRAEVPDMTGIQGLAIKPGDVVFHGSDTEPALHTAMVLVWGPPTHYQKERNPQPRSNWPSDDNSTSAASLPWIIDRDGPGYPRSFHDVGGDTEYRVEFVHIPDWITLPASVKLYGPVER